MYRHTRCRTPIGEVTLACDEAGALVGLWMEGQKYFLGGLPERPVAQDDVPVFAQTRDWLDRYFAGERPAISELPLAPIGSAFRQEVWRILCEIPYGEVTTYGEIGRKLAVRHGSDRTSARAVGGAVGHNPISIIVPCHRVIGADGSLTGYAGGLERKLALLTHEGVDAGRPFVSSGGAAL